MLLFQPMQLKTGIKRFGKPAIAALLVAIMSFLTLAAPCAPLHQQLHHGDHGACDTCVLCTMIQGHVDCSAPAPIPCEFVSCFVNLTPAIHFVAPHQVDIRLGPSRAPPYC